MFNFLILFKLFISAIQLIRKNRDFLGSLVSG